MRIAFGLIALCAVGAMAGDGQWKRAIVHEHNEQHSACEGANCEAKAVHKAGDGSIVVHPKGDAGYNATGEYTGQNTPHEDKPERVCCHVCPRKCSESTGKCFHKCYKVCGSACKVEAHEGECEIGKDCEMTEKTGGCDKPAEPAATGATGVESKVVDVTEPEVVKHHGHAEATGPAATGVEGVHCGAGTGKPCEEPEVITEDDIETAEVAEDEAAEETDRKGGEQRSLRA